MHHIDTPPPPPCPRCGGPGQRSERKYAHLGAFDCRGRCGFYEGTDSEWMRPEYVASRERFKGEG